MIKIASNSNLAHLQFMHELQMSWGCSGMWTGEVDWGSELGKEPNVYVVTPKPRTPFFVKRLTSRSINVQIPMGGRLQELSHGSKFSGHFGEFSGQPLGVIWGRFVPDTDGRTLPDLQKLTVWQQGFGMATYIYIYIY